MQPVISMIVARARGGVIGYGGQMPWHAPADLKHFKKVTMGKPVIMGRRTFESIGKPLPGRLNIIISRKSQDELGLTDADLIVAASLEEALSACENQPEVMIIGGAQIYDQVKMHAHRLYLTELALSPTGGDRFFPDPTSDWVLVSEEHRPADHKNPEMTFKLYERSV